ncbi:MAG: SAM-dependent methyltransferase [Hyphomicrobiales bacterium]|nr:SAM-dependent methyltransferase [Hyphomicrobiales bacterium]
MTGFSPDWLALREPADHAARSGDVARDVFTHFAGKDSMTVADLGCGTGSNLRAMAEHLPARQTWRLVDWDRHLLDAARGRLVGWADRAETLGVDMRLLKGDHDITLRLEQADLAQDFERVLERDADLITATAFFDLVSANWIDDFVAVLARRRLPLYAILTYDGHEQWAPPHGRDAPMLAAFHAHQQRDKGFGPAAGPFAAAHLARALEEQGYRVASASSPWRLDEAQRGLMGELARGAANAVAETGLVGESDIASWRAARESAEACVIGHVDLFATPA